MRLLKPIVAVSVTVGLTLASVLPVSASQAQPAAPQSSNDQSQQQADPLRSVSLNLPNGLQPDGAVTDRAAVLETSEQTPVAAGETTLFEPTAQERNELLQAGSTARTQATQQQNSADVVKEIQSPEITSDSPFSMVGIKWDDTEVSDNLGISFRSKSNGNWTDWQSVEVNTEGPDKGKGANPDSTVKGSDPLSVENATAVQVKLTLNDGAFPASANIGLITDVGPSTSTTSQAATQQAATQSNSSTTNSVSAPTIVTRAQWGADESWMNWTPNYSSSIEAAVIHHTASTNNYYTVAEAQAQVREVYYYHASYLGWGDIGYHFLVDKFGNIYEGRTGALTTAVEAGHSYGYNANTIGIAMLGNYDVVAPTQAQIDAVGRLTGWKLAQQNQYDIFGTWNSYTGVALPRVHGHRDNGATACPGQYGYAQLGNIKTIASNYQKSASTPAPGYSTSGAIGTEYNRLGGSSGRLGKPTGNQVNNLKNGGSYQNFQNGKIHWTSSTGARATFGAVGNKWASVSWENGILGYPSSNEASGLKNGGAYQNFQNGKIHWTSSTGAVITRGAIGTQWGDVKWENGVLGYPTADEVNGLKNGGSYQNFQNGKIHWTSSTGAHTTTGAIANRWAGYKWEGGILGYPTSNENKGLKNGGSYQDFQSGQVHWSSATGAHATRGGINSAWATAKWESGFLGYPTGEEVDGLKNGGSYQNFQGGQIHWSPSTGAQATSGGIHSFWAKNGYEKGSLGYPISGEYQTSGGVAQKFQGGILYWSSSTHTVSVR